MGIAGVAILWMMISFMRGIIGLVKFLVWKRHPLAEGTIVQIKESTKNYSKNGEDLKSITYLYDLEINIENEKYLIDFKNTENVNTKAKNKITLGSVIPVYFNQAKNKIAVQKELKRDLWQWWALFAGCIVILVLCYFILRAIS